ncbi:hypothetical protein NGRA_0523 [Nosema granulosis]|uniref:Uncharacterized protein n=1 Tax=Nosema granulosis TaxID=83296 RepID=A0A9P6L0A1_9MICR|nr:hypothetical protein NGRA_0523 [Nosema granulosis]
MFLLWLCVISTSLNTILYKKIRIRSIPYTNFVIAEKISDFSDQVFYTSNVDHLTSDFNSISSIEKEKDKYKIKIGNYYICRDDELTCGSTPKHDICMNSDNQEIDCRECKMKSIKLCEKNPSLWEIERKPLGFIIKSKDMCLTLDHKLILDKCKDRKDQLYGFEDYELMSCILGLNINKKPENYKDLLDKKKIEKLLDNIKDPKLKDEVKKDIEKKKDFEKYIKEKIPSIDKKPKIKKVWGNLWKYDFSGNNYNWKRPKLGFFCTKWF